jgi:hypothetical protein
LASLERSINNEEDPDLKENINSDLVNSFVFEQVSYTNEEINIADYSELENISDTIPQTTFIN